MFFGAPQIPYRKVAKNRHRVRWNKPCPKQWSKIMSYMSHSVFGGKEGTRDIHGLWGEGVNLKMCVCVCSAEFL